MTTVRPDALGSDKLKTGVNLYLYQVVSNPAHSNADLPTRRADGALARRPQIALDLHYLLSFYGNDADLEPQRLLGSVARALHARPVLTRDAIVRTLQQSDAPPWIAASNLAEQIDRVRFTPMLLSLEELSKIWSVFFQTKYALSVAYAGSVVLIETEDVAIHPGVPVRERTVSVVPVRSPTIDRVRAVGGDTQPILAGGTIEILGRQLKGEATAVLVDGTEVAARSVSDQRIVVELASAVSAGPHGVQVVHARTVEGRAANRRSVDSNLAAFVLRPSVNSAAVADVSGVGAVQRMEHITLQLSPPIGALQRVAVLLQSLSAGGVGLRCPCAPPMTDSDRLTVPIPGAPAGEYLVRVEVDGVESLLTIDDAGLATGPRVSVS